jgi:glucokinase
VTRTVVAAVDVGGTRIKAALVGQEGDQVASYTWPTPGQLNRSGALVDAVAATVERLRQDAGELDIRVVGCGLVVPGIVDDARGVAVYASNLGWRDLPVTGPLEDALGLPVALGHDVRAGLVAEARWGAARGSRNVLFLPVGTGIAGALMLDGHVVVADGWSGEVGHVVVEPDGPPCGCGGRGCLESIASAAAVERAYAARAPVMAGDAPGARVDAEQVADLVVAGDPTARAVWDRAVDALARAVVMVSTATGVDHVLLGGGLAQSGAVLLNPLRERVQASLTFQRMPRIERATLGDRAGCLGAACLAWEVV